MKRSQYGPQGSPGEMGHPGACTRGAAQSHSEALSGPAGAPVHDTGGPGPPGCSAGTSRFGAKLIQAAAVSPGSQPSGLAEPSPGTTPPPHRSTGESACCVVPSCWDWQIGGHPQVPEVGAWVRNGTPLPLPRGGQGLPSTPLPAQCQSSQYQCPAKAWEPAQWDVPASWGEGCCLCPGTLLSRLACGDPARSAQTAWGPHGHSGLLPF